MVASKECATCENKFIGRGGAKYCSPACRNRAYRARRPANRRAIRHTQSVTVSLAGGEHCAEARELLDGLDAELKANAEQLGAALKWTAAEKVLLDLIASTVDRRQDLQRLFDEAEKPSALVRISGELRLLDAQISRLLKSISTEPTLPGPRRSVRSQKASKAALSRWNRGSS